MIEELQAILDLLGDMSGIAGWIFGGWLVFKAVILLSTTGATVYLMTLGIKSLLQYLTQLTESRVKRDEIQQRPIVKDVEIQGMCISSDGTYESVVHSLKTIKSHVNTSGGAYLHSYDADWLKDAVAEKIKRDNTPPGEE